MLSLRITLIAVVVAGLSFTTFASAENDSNVITGAGAHFSWIVFDGQHKALESHVGRPIKLFGKEQMLGAGCNAGIKMAKSNRPGHEAFGLVCCQLGNKEIKEGDLRVYPVAKEPILILVNRDNPVNNLSLRQVRDVFSGKITNWKQVGGEDRPIVVVLRPHCKDRPGHWKTILPEIDRFRKDRVNVRSAADMVQRVNDFSGAIGHTGAAWKFEPDNKVKAIAISGIQPTAKNLKNGAYPFYRTLSAVTNSHASKQVVSLIEYARTSTEFREIAKKYELVTLK